MLITRCNTLSELNELASETIIHELQHNPKSLVCAATGNSPTGVYKKLTEKKENINTSGLRFIKLDEWYGLGINDEGSCEKYLHEHLFNPLGISNSQYIAFNGKTTRPEKELQNVDNYLDEHGPIDLCILGLGKNGHIAFNEPADILQPRAHLSPLSSTSLEHTMIKSTGEPIKYGMTLGMTDILQSKKIILLVNGSHKNAIMQKLMERKISTQLPASFLWLHANAQCFYCDNDN
ncbi:galactosamine-6-phosphate isomerase [Mucilaginibacter sp. BT774]|uniref:galactosamine-6-phosphate isomerase n=1 Tax=Mucilaginibacter sp. BT774 TaxID=3062276 RepID=UPI0026770983|nr:galactosamine-6-phosphate isomerase [Mucilaginibacter sp. BT774]MDO3625638.1 galactosamine-6-phosphate isomerase [Mucilaginibacter sp. BT774]